jgi:hypothetical protein
MKTALPGGKRTGTLLLLLPFSLILILLPPAQSYRAAQPSSNAAVFHRFRDWSTRHLLYPHTGPLSALNAVEREPRAQFAWRDWDRLEGRDSASFRLRRLAAGEARGQQTMGRDWSISLGAGTTAPAQSPAEFTLNDDTPDCTNDYAVFPVDVAGSAAQPNIVAFNNLYSGTIGITEGLCNRAHSGSDTGIAGTVLWSYNVNAVGGSIATSPVTSLDGTKIAFVESATGKPAHFHVLAWKSGDGRNAADLQSVAKPVQITTFSSTAPAAGSGAATDLALGAAAADIDTNSSPFIDYTTDRAYVGNNAGILYRINNAFCPKGGCAAPSLDTTWGTDGAVTVGCGTTLTGPVLDFVTGNVFVGCANGLLYGFSSTGAALAFGPVTVGNGSADGGIVDPPLVDGVNSLVYAVSGTGAAPHTTHAVVFQVSTLLRSPCGGTACIATVGGNGQFPAHDPDFNNAFYSGAAPTSWILYMGGFTAAGRPRIFGITFDTVATEPATAMTTGTPTHVFTLTTTVGPFTPFTEFLNGTTDFLFFGSVSIPAAGDFNVGSLTITTGFPAGTTSTAVEGGGPSAIVVDNDNTTVVEGANIYFGTQSCGTTAGCTNGNSAVKLTQVGFH